MGVWGQLAAALYYANSEINDRFYVASIKAKNTVREL